MFHTNWKKEFLTIPNLLSLFRLALIPVYMTLYRNAATGKDYLLAGTVLTLSCLTDMADGYIARRFHMVSTVGKVLDPLADKATQFTLTLCLSMKYPVLGLVLILFVIKESFQLLAMLISFRHGKVLPGALPSGKICTLVLFSSLIGMVLFPNLSQKLVNSIALTDAVFLMLSFVCYILAYVGKYAKITDIHPKET